jgi:hypothetical protein
MSHTLAILTAGRKEYLDITIGSLEKHLKGSISEKIIFDNSDGPAIVYEGYKTIKVPSFGLPYGFDRHARAIKFIFAYLKKAKNEYVVFFEEDWELLEDLIVDDLSIHLNDSFNQIRMYSRGDFGVFAEVTKDIIVTSETFSFSWNPNIFSKRICNLRYPIGEAHEEKFGNVLGPNFLLYKHKHPVVKHVGEYSIEKPMRWTEDYHREWL